MSKECDTMATAKHGNMGNVNASIHNVYVKKLLSKDEIKVYNAIFKDIYEVYGLETRPADQLLLSMVCIDYVRTLRGYVTEATTTDDVGDAIDRATRAIRNNLSEMGITGKQRPVNEATASLTAIFNMLSNKP